MSCDTFGMTTDAPLSIAHVLLTRRFAGSERHAVELANAQAAQGKDDTLILRKAGAEDRPDAIAHRVDKGVRVIVFVIVLFFRSVIAVAGLSLSVGERWIANLHPSI